MSLLNAMISLIIEIVMSVIMGFVSFCQVVAEIIRSVLHGE